MKKFLSLILLSLSAPAIAYAAGSENQSPFKWTLDLRSQYVDEENVDLGTRDEKTSGALSLNSKLKLFYRPVRNLLTYIEGDAVKSFGDGIKTEDENGLSRPARDYLELRQAWLRFHKVLDTPFQFQLGRQRIREDYALWWNRDLDAMRAIYAGEDFKGFIGIAQNLASYRSSEDMHESSKDQLHLMGEASFGLNPSTKLEWRGLYEDDHSGHADIGDEVERDNFDREDGQLGWMGLRLAGTATPKFSGFKYRLDGLVMAGNSDDLLVTSGIVTGSRQEDLLGFAFDGGLEIPLAQGRAPNLLLGYAYGSPEFRQSEIYGNSSPMGYSTSTIHHYGEALRPELSNLHVLTAGLSSPILTKSDFTVLYHYYIQDDQTDRLRSSRIRAFTDGKSAYLGQELDAVLNISLDDEIPTLTNLEGSKKFRLSSGIFRAGEAFAEASGEYYYRFLAEFSIRY